MEFIINFYDKKEKIQKPKNFQELKKEIEKLFNLNSFDCENNMLFKFIDEDGDMIEIVVDYDYEQFLKKNLNEISIELNKKCINLIRNSCSFNEKEGKVEIEKNKLKKNLEKISDYKNEKNKEGVFNKWFNFIKNIPMKIWK